MTSSRFKAFFSNYARNVDKAQSVGFWKLSDALVEAIILKEIQNLSTEDVILDAGGGTGRWIERLATKIPCKFLLYDLSADMLDEAKKRVHSGHLSERVSILRGDLEDMRDVPSDSIAACISLYAPLCFVHNPANAISEIFRILRPGGSVVFMVHGFYNALYSKITNDLISPAEIKQMYEGGRVQWKGLVPELHTFSAAKLSCLMKAGGLMPHASYGVPVFVQPGKEDFSANNMEASPVSVALGNSHFFEAVFALEMAENSKPDILERGVNVMVVAKKPDS